VRFSRSRVKSDIFWRKLTELCLDDIITLTDATPEHWPGDKNEPGDTSCRSFETFKAGRYKGWPANADASFLTLFAHTYALPPHAGSWQATLADDLHLAWGQVADVTVDVSARSRAWRLGTIYCEDDGFPDPFLPAQMDTKRFNNLVAFTARCRTGVWGRGNQIQANTILSTVQHIGQTFELGRYPDPRLGGASTASTDLHLTVSHLYHSYRSTDPASQSLVVLPVNVFPDILQDKRKLDDPLEQAMADFVVIAFYFLLRVGEYTCPSSNKRTQTVQFRRCDVTFWKLLPGGLHHQVDPKATLDKLLTTTDSVTLMLSNQKSGVRDATPNHEAVPGLFCPVKSLA
jgi:hypothetical protein